MSDETTDAADLCLVPVSTIVHLARRNLLTDHERRTLLDALGHGEGCVPRHKAGGYCCVHGDVRP